ncbi:MAG: SH3 domain-containing protein [Hyphomicrobiales bacterium]|nr:SH3 domain-containing protein [Hyphomicrobiales bacterium]MCP5001975.1 SH3 domain-containing protein [Hyphomicrobiales bacterium]
MRKTLFGALIAAMGLLAGPAVPAELDVSVMMWADGGRKVCGAGTVSGADSGNALSVRSGPGSGHGVIDKIKVGDRVWIFDENNGWFGIVYGTRNVNCSPIRANRPYDGPGKSGWVFGKYVTIVAG